MSNPYLDALADQHGNDWPKEAFKRLLDLHGLRIIRDLSGDEQTEYRSLRDWLEQIIEAGIAFQQSSYLEH